MCKRVLTAILSGAVVLVLGGQDVVAAGHHVMTLPLKETVSGSAFSVAIDTNGDQVPGLAGVLEGSSNVGPVTLQFFKELDIINAAPSNKCAADEVNVPLVESTKVPRFAKGDLMYLKTTAEVFCVNLLTGALLSRKS